MESTDITSLTPQPAKPLVRVAFVCHDGLSTLNFCRWFGAEFARRSDVRFFTISSKDEYAAEVSALGGEHIDLTTSRYIDPLRDLGYFMRLFQVCRREQFDAVVTLGTKPNIYGPVAARMAGVPRIVLSVRGLGRTFNEPGGILRRAMTMLYRQACQCSHRVWFTSAADRDLTIAEGIADAAQAFLTTNSVDPDFFSMLSLLTPVADARASLGIAQSDVVTIMVARMIWLKGIREFIDAARQVRRTRPDAKFVLVAPLEPGSPEAVPASFVKDAADSGDVIWLEFRKDIREMYAMADIAVLPSYYKEGGYPRALLEPMSLGKPVIGADTPECRGPVEPGGNGFLVPPRDTAALADRITQLIADESMRVRFGARSRQLVLERFSDRIVGEQVLAEIGLQPAKGHS